ncbi:hypothetical protein [Clostridium luticellarii]|uniref:Uncharacterized protein n=1 Tax=Clostridium luticellarii TaxID=1691940 RepID=A0A2T0BQ60_9CLOT|nr:hypothetical protein [Clostridium luticellarii]PRR86009.1 hypothetical protein CLLU_10370 [Clostridium luticellarii]
MSSEIKISMTSFTDFSLTTDSRKLNKVREIKNRARSTYTPATDYWKQLREEIVNINKNKLSLEHLKNLSNTIDPKKRSNYIKAINGYIKFFKKYLKDDFTFFAPKKDLWNYDTLSINVNPELGFVIDKKLYLIKLYFKEATTSAEIILNKTRAEEIAYLMWTTLSDFYKNKNVSMCFLNVSKGQLVIPEFDKNDQKIVLSVSAKSFINYWNQC